MNSVGYVSHGDFCRGPMRKERLEEAPAHLAMQAAHAIRRPASPHRQIRHIEVFRGVVWVLAAQRQQIKQRNAKLLAGVAAQALFDEGRSETVKTDGYRGMGGEEIACSRGGQRHFEGLSCGLHETARAFQHGERGMPFIQVAHFRFDPECGEQSPSADPKDQLLHEAHVWPAAIKLAGDPAIGWKVRGVIAVQQVEQSWLRKTGQ